MADADVATKAPESDAQEDAQPRDTEAEKISGIQGDTKPEQGSASMGVSRTGRIMRGGIRGEGILVV